MGAAQREEAAMRRWTRMLVAGSAAVSAAACEHMAEGAGAFLIGGAVYVVEDGLREQQCADRYAGDPPSRSLCEFRSGLDNDWDGEGW
jgi:hypothetical protein